MKPIEFKLAKLAKEKGFNSPTKLHYEHSLTSQEDEEDGFSGPFGWEKGETNLQDGYIINNGHGDHTSKSWFLCAAPTPFELQEWILENTDFLFWVAPKSLSSSHGWGFNIIRYKNGVLTTNIQHAGQTNSLTFKEALIEGIEVLLQLL